MAEPPPPLRNAERGGVYTLKYVPARWPSGQRTADQRRFPRFEPAQEEILGITWCATASSPIPKRSAEAVALHVVTPFLLLFQSN